MSETTPSPSDPPQSAPTPPPPSDGAHQPPQPPHTHPRRRGLRIAGLVVGGLALLFIGVGIGNASGGSSIPGYQHQVSRAHASLKTERASLKTEQASLAAEQGQVQSAQAAAQTATAKADAKAQAQYAGKVAALKQQQQTVAKEARTLKAEQGQIQANTISADGVYVVGKDISPGTWHTSGDGGGGDQCYYATLNSTNTSDISDNNNFDGPETVNLSGVVAFDISGPCTWIKSG
jgi:type IV secretory pathway VirB10-like protein